MKKKIKIISVNISKEKGTVKKSVEQIEITDRGVDADAHSGDWHRQISLLGTESFDKFALEAGREIKYGEFAENITTTGVALEKTNPLDRFTCGDVVLEVTQIGKKCHGDKCAIYKEVGSCVMPKEGIFCRVLGKGTLKPGDEMIYHQKTIKVLIITLSDRAYKGVYPDKSGPEIQQKTEAFLNTLKWPFEIELKLIPDNAEKLALLVSEAKNQYDIIFTTGGTGIGEKDITIETVKPLLTKEIPGIMEMIRMKYGMEKPNALISRSIAGLVGRTLIYTLPGSVKAVREYTEEIFKTIEHSLFMIYGIDRH